MPGDDAGCGAALSRKGRGAGRRNDAGDECGRHGSVGARGVRYRGCERLYADQRIFRSDVAFPTEQIAGAVSPGVDVFRRCGNDCRRGRAGIRGGAYDALLFNAPVPGEHGTLLVHDGVSVPLSAASAGGQCRAADGTAAARLGGDIAADRVVSFEIRAAVSAGGGRAGV